MHAAANLVLPGSGYLLQGRRLVLGALLVSATVIWVMMGILHVLTLDAHWSHLHPSSLPGIGAQVLLYCAHHVLLGSATAWDAWKMDRRHKAQASPGV